MLVGVHSFSKSVCSTYCVWHSQVGAINRAGAALPALLQFPLVGGEVRVGVGGADRSESGSPGKKR